MLFMSTKNLFPNPTHLGHSTFVFTIGFYIRQKPNLNFYMFVSMMITIDSEASQFLSFQPAYRNDF